MTLVYFDTETGGTDPKHPTIQLAAVAMDGAKELGSFEQKIQFRVEDCDPEALAMNHYKAEAWADAVTGAVTASRFAAWLRPFCTVDRVSKAGNPYRVAVLAGYNAVRFDEPRLRELFGTQFCPWDYRVRDVLQLAIWYYDALGHPPKDFKQATVAAALGIDAGDAHDALVDVRTCAAIAVALQGEWGGW